MMKDAYFASDSYALTGPSIVNKYYRELLGDRFTFSKKEKNLLRRLFSGAKMVLGHKVLIISGASKMDYFLVSLAKATGKRIVYIMHGCIQEENRINKVESPGETKLELFYLRFADRVLCVSEQFAKWVKAYYPQFEKKVFPLVNGVDWNVLKSKKESTVRDEKAISIVGGGIPRKNVKKVCEAVSMLCEETGEEYLLKVFGRDDLDTDVVKSYPFVRYYGKVPREQFFAEISETKLFVQNSIFDSFAMTPLEALTCGCSILCSKDVGALSLFKDLQDQDVVYNCFDPGEIKNKIAHLLACPNHDRLINGLDKYETSFEHRAEELNQYVKSLIGD